MTQKMFSPSFIFLLIASLMQAQSSAKIAPSISGTCNGYGSGQNVIVEVKCGDGLTKAQAQQLADEYTALLLLTKQDKGAFAEVLKRLTAISKELSATKSTVSSTNVGIGIASGGGNVTDSPVTVNLGARYPIPAFTWSQRTGTLPNVQREMSQLFATNPNLRPPVVVTPTPPTVVVTVTIQAPFSRPAFKVQCDKPCRIVGMPVISPKPPSRIELSDYGKDVLVLGLVSDTPLPSGTSTSFEVVAEDDSTFQVSNAAPFILP